MTDNEIIKALKCCVLGECEECPAYDYINCNNAVKRLAIDLINRQKEAIDGLIAGQETQQKCIVEKDKQIEERKKDVDYWMVQTRMAREKVKTAKSEAIKEFWGRLKKSIKTSVEDAWHGDGNGIYDAEYVLDDGDNLVKEMAER